MSQENLLGLATWLRMALEGEDLEPFAEYLMDRAKNDEQDAAALLDLSYVAQFKGQNDWAMSLQLEALKQQQVYHLGSIDKLSGLQVMALSTPGLITDVTPVESLLSPFDVNLKLSFVGELVESMGGLPNHDILVNSIGNRDIYHNYLEGIAGLFDEWLFPVINPPSKVVKVVPKNIKKTFEAAEDIEYIEKNQMSSWDLNTIQHTAQGWLPEYQVFVVNGEFYLHSVLLHDSIDSVGLSYYAVNMQENALKREQEELLFREFKTQVEGHYQSALESLNRTVMLDYASFDCIPLVDGRLLVTKVDTAALVHNIENIRPSYQTEAHFKIMQAFYKMLLAKRR